MQEHIVKSYDDELNRLKRYLLEMLDATHKQLFKTNEMLFSGDFNNYKSIITDDVIIDLLDKKIVDLSLEIFSTRNPVAYDLRFVFASSHISRNIERIGDNICKICSYVNDITVVHADINMQLLQMFLLLLEMQQKLKESLLINDLEPVKKVFSLDIQVDDLFANVAKSVLTEMTKSTNNIVNLNAYSLIARSLERIGDHFVNIARYVDFMEDGDLKY